MKRCRSFLCASSFSLVQIFPSSGDDEVQQVLQENTRRHVRRGIRHKRIVLSRLSAEEIQYTSKLLQFLTFGIGMEVHHDVTPLLLGASTSSDAQNPLFECVVDNGGVPVTGWLRFRRDGNAMSGICRRVILNTLTRQAEGFCHVSFRGNVARHAAATAHSPVLSKSVSFVGPEANLQPLRAFSHRLAVQQIQSIRDLWSQSVKTDTTRFASIFPSEVLLLACFVLTGPSPRPLSTPEWTSWSHAVETASSSIACHTLPAHQMVAHMQAIWSARLSVRSSTSATGFAVTGAGYGDSARKKLEVVAGITPQSTGEVSSSPVPMALIQRASVKFSSSLRAAFHPKLPTGTLHLDVTTEVVSCWWRLAVLLGRPSSEPGAMERALQLVCCDKLLKRAVSRAAEVATKLNEPDTHWCQALDSVGELCLLLWHVAVTRDIKGGTQRHFLTCVGPRVSEKVATCLHRVRVTVNTMQMELHSNTQGTETSDSTDEDQSASAGQHGANQMALRSIQCAFPETSQFASGEWVVGAAEEQQQNSFEAEAATKSARGIPYVRSHSEFCAAAVPDVRLSYFTAVQSAHRLLTVLNDREGTLEMCDSLRECIDALEWLQVRMFGTLHGLLPYTSENSMWGWIGTPYAISAYQCTFTDAQSLVCVRIRSHVSQDEESASHRVSPLAAAVSSASLFLRNCNGGRMDVVVVLNDLQRPPPRAVAPPSGTMELAVVLEPWVDKHRSSGWEYLKQLKIRVQAADRFHDQLLLRFHSRSRSGADSKRTFVSAALDACLALVVRRERVMFVVDSPSSLIAFTSIRESR